MKVGRWFLPEEPDVVGLLRSQAAITLEALDGFAAWARGDAGAAAAVRAVQPRGDRARRELMRTLRAAFVVPLEPEDVFALSRSIDWILDLACDLVAEAEVMKCEPDAGIAEMARILVDGVRRLDEAVASLGEDGGDPTTERAEAAVESEHELEAAYYRGMAALLDVEDRGRRIALRELYRRSSQIANVVVDVAERLMYAVIKQS